MTPEAFLDHLRSGDDQIAIVCDAISVSYRELHDEILQEVYNLRSQSVIRTTVLLVDEFSPRSIATLFALWLTGNVVALATPGNATGALTIAVSAQFIIERGAMTIAGSKWPGPAGAAIGKLLESGDAGFVVFSSGTTGTPKGVVHRTSRFLANYCSAEPCGAILAFLLFDHIGGLATLFQALATHGVLVIPKERSPQEISRCIEQFGVNSLHVSPTMLRLAILSGVFRRINNMDTLRTVYFGSEPSSASLLQLVKRELPSVRLRQLYGMSEVGVLPCISNPDDPTWMKIEDDAFSVRVVEGILLVKSHTMMVGYIANNHELTDDGFFVTGDIAECQDGYFRVAGRLNDFINVGGQNVSPSQVERALEGISNVSEVLVYGEPNAILGQIVAARFVLLEEEDLGEFRKRVLLAAKTLLPQHEIPRVITVGATPAYTARFKKARNPKHIASAICASDKWRTEMTDTIALRESIAEILYVPVNELTDEMQLSESKYWDSLAIVNVIALIFEKTGATVTDDEIANLNTVGEILSLASAKGAH